MLNVPKPISHPRISAALLLLGLSACAVKGPVQQGAVDTALEPVPLIKQAHLLKAPTDPLLAGLSASELNQCAQRAKLKFSPYWPVVSERSAYVRHRVLSILHELKAPDALQVVPVVESTYDPYALSPSGASGLWQLMPRTAKGLGVKWTVLIDGRRHVETSTKAAVQYLKKLHDRFDSWPLAFAAYHMGPNALGRKLAEQPWKAGDGLDTMPVPEITKEYVRNIIGLAVLVDRGELRFKPAIKTSPVKLSGPFDLVAMSRQLGKDQLELFRFNPGLNLARAHLPITIHVPSSDITSWSQQPRLRLPKYRLVAVKKGESLWSIAHRYHVSVSSLKSTNALRSNILRIGQTIRIPSEDGSILAVANPLLSNGKRLRYSVRKGDSLWSIAKRFGTTPAAIAKANNMSLHSPIFPGDKIWVHAHPKRNES
ncbi:MAG: LysM peptidoglycan-binding domain-containing protein [Zetaproteobacteria bacterium]|nr:MAG: LysM peptidoglycan-binding domain-containing protein [Zetaproteobacteria bacterium]